MKTLVFSILFSAFSFFAMASTTNTEPVKSMQKQLSELIKKSNFYKSHKVQEVKIIVRFTFNDDNEIVVISTDNEDYDESIKAVMNYKALELDEDLSSRVFILPIRVERKYEK